MKVAPKNLKIPSAQDDLTVEEEEDFREKVADSSNWIVARTIYCSLSINGEVRLEAEHDLESAGQVG